MKLSDIHYPPGTDSHERRVDRVIHDLWRAHPEYPSTFSGCANDGCHNMGRGGGLCSDCIVQCLGEVTGNLDAAKGLEQVVIAARVLSKQLRDSRPDKSTEG